MDFYNDPLKVDEYEKMCAEYDGSELYEVLERNLEENSTLLELGCGPGNDIHYLQKKYRVTGSDYSDEFLRRCMERFDNVPFLKLDGKSILTEKTFDCIFSNKVLHHLTHGELESSFQRQQEVLVPNGLFAHTFWLGDKEMTMEGMLFVFHNRDQLLNMVAKYFSIVEAYIYKEFEQDDSVFILAKNDH
ncbi:class I SAM-dependent methyltransferase [bacterium]|nr:class I SAM-dependent methyltransferase [bacterium]